MQRIYSLIGKGTFKCKSFIRKTGALMSLRVDEETLRSVRSLLSRMEGKVKLYFIPKENAPQCEIIRKILSFLTDLTSKLEVIELSSSDLTAKEMDLDLAPAIVIHGKDRYNVRYFGVPGGYEFGVLVEDIVDASIGKPSLPQSVLESLVKIDSPVHIRVFVTPTCPYCPLAARAAHAYAIANTNIVADVIEAMEFPELAERYNVQAVPKVIINDDVEFEGAVPHDFFIEKIMEAIED